MQDQYIDLSAGLDQSDEDRPGSIRFARVQPEFSMRLTLEEHLGASAATAANGWDGDRLRLLDDGAGACVLQWRTLWDDEAHAHAFELEARRFIESRAPRWNGRVIRPAAVEASVVVVELARFPVWSRDLVGWAR